MDHRVYVLVGDLRDFISNPTDNAQRISGRLKRAEIALPGLVLGVGLRNSK